MYVSDAIRDKVRILHFREALEGRARKNVVTTSTAAEEEPVMAPLDEGQIQGISRVFERTLLKEQREMDELAGVAPEQEVAGGMMRMMMKIRAERAGPAGNSDRSARAQQIISHSSTAAAFASAENPPKEHTVSFALHARAVDPRSNDDPLARDVNAVRMIMENIADWEFHAQHDGDTLTVPVFLQVVRLLESNLRAACPSINNYQTLDMLMELKGMGCLNDIKNLQHLTRSTVGAYLAAQNGDAQPLAQLNRSLEGFIKFSTRFYGDQIPVHVPMRTLAQALEKQGDRPYAPGGANPSPL